jgi:hypothetical protein
VDRRLYRNPRASNPAPSSVSVLGSGTPDAEVVTSMMEVVGPLPVCRLD